MCKLIFIEGLPGTGKTTIAKWLFDCLEEKRSKVVLLLEGDPQILCDFHEMAGMANHIFDENVRNTLKHARI